MGAAENDGSLRAASPPPIPPPTRTARRTQTSPGRPTHQTSASRPHYEFTRLSSASAHKR